MLAGNSVESKCKYTHCLQSVRDKQHQSGAFRCWFRLLICANKVHGASGAKVTDSYLQVVRTTFVLVCWLDVVDLFFRYASLDVIFLKG